MQQDRLPVERSQQRRGGSERGRGARASPYSRAEGRRSDAGDGKWQHDMYDQMSHSGHHRRGPGSYGGRQGGASPDTPSAKLLVQGLHYDVSEEELQGLFERIGPTIKCFIRYDRSGRSTGTATVIYKDVHHAATARQEYDGANAKGQPIKISFEPLREPRASANGQGGDLLSRLGGGGGGELLTRIGGGQKGRPPAHAPRGPAMMAERSGDAGHRNGRRGGRGGRGGASGNSGGRQARGPPPSADALDAELDAFMRKPASASMAASEHVPSSADKDVDMQ